jgi:hypothetical protein
LIVEVVQINLPGLRRRHDHAGRLSLLLLLLLVLLFRALALDLDLGLEGCDALKEQVDSVLVLKSLHILLSKSVRKHQNLITHFLVHHLKLRLELSIEFYAGVSRAVPAAIRPAADAIIASSALTLQALLNAGGAERRSALTTRSNSRGSQRLFLPPSLYLIIRQNRRLILIANVALATLC